MRAEFLPFSPPAIGDDEIAEVVSVLRSAWITTGPRTKQFEVEFAKRLGAPSALALNSCTAALHVALLAKGIGPGDEVITTPMTFAASANVIEHVGARPVLVDVSADTLNLDPDLAAKALTPKTRALMPVHYAGHPADMDPIREIAGRSDLVVVEDAAHALPATYKGKIIGSTPNPVAFSFYATKNLTTAEGGMLTGEPDFLAEAQVVALHGMSRDAWKRYEKGGSWRYDIIRPGFKYNMPDVAAAIGLAQLRRLDAMQDRRRAIVRHYQARFRGHPALTLPVERGGVEHAWHLFPIRLNLERLAITRDAFIEAMREANIGTSVHFIPLHMHSYYRKKYGLRPDDLPVATAAFERLVSLPLHPGLTDADVDDVCQAVERITAKYAR